jgi:hypothetical protein
MTDKDLKDKADRRGYITIKNGDSEAEILPESFHVYEERGWTLVESAKAKKSTRSPARTKSDPDKA